MLPCVVWAEFGSPFDMRYIDQDVDQQVSIIGDKIPIMPVLQQLIAIQGKSVVFVSPIKGTITLAVSQVSPQLAMQHILRSKKMCVQEADSVLYVGTCIDIHAMPDNVLEAQPLTTTLSVHHRPIASVVAALKKQLRIPESAWVEIDMKGSTFTVCVLPDTLAAIKNQMALIDVEPQQVRIKGYLASVDDSSLAALGVRFLHQKSKASTSQVAATIGQLFPGGFHNISLVLRALEQEGHAHILSSPELIATVGKKALIETGNEIPYMEKQTDGSGGVVFKKAVLSLSVTPEVLGHNKVRMHIAMSQDQPGSDYTGLVAIQTRKIATDTVVNSGEILVLGGMFEQYKNDAKNHVPLLAKIPLVGLLFRDDEAIIQKRQLLIFIRPEIVN